MWHWSTQAPLIVGNPAAREKGRARSQPVSLLDLYPTLVDLCGLPANSGNEGMSLRPLLENSKANHPPVVTTYWPDNHSVRDERWRYTRYKDGSEELFDEVKDPNEFHNLAGDARYADVKRRLAGVMPGKSAEPAPERSAFDFDFASYSYRLKGK